MGASMVQLQGSELIKLSVQDKPKNLVVLRGNGSSRLFEAFPLVEAFNAEHKTNLTVLSHDVADVSIDTVHVWMKLPGFATDASIAYEVPGIPFGNEVVFNSQGEPKVVFATGSHKGEKDAALVASGMTSADISYTMGGKTRTLKEMLHADGIESLLDTDLKIVSEIILNIPDERLKIVPRFPDASGWHTPHVGTGVPSGKNVKESPDARYLFRLGGSPYVGILARLAHSGTLRKYVDASQCASHRFGVVAEVPDQDIGKMAVFLKASKPDSAAIEVIGIPPGRLSELYYGAVASVGSMKGVVDEKLLAPLKEFLDAMGKARF